MITTDERLVSVSGIAPERGFSPAFAFLPVASSLTRSGGDDDDTDDDDDNGDSNPLGDEWEDLTGEQGGDGSEDGDPHPPQQ